MNSQKEIKKILEKMLETPSHSFKSDSWYELGFGKQLLDAFLSCPNLSVTFNKCLHVLGTGASMLDYKDVIIWLIERARAIGVDAALYN